MPYINLKSNLQPPELYHCTDAKHQQDKVDHKIRSRLVSRQVASNAHGQHAIKIYSVGSQVTSIVDDVTTCSILLDGVTTSDKSTGKKKKH